MIDHAAAREAMLALQIEARGIANPALSAALRDVPREAFVPDNLAAFAYDDTPLPIAGGQTISQPYIVALMIDSAGVKPRSRVLEIGAGSGYAAAVMGRIADRVVAIERRAELARLAAVRMTRLGYDNVRIVHGDGSAGWPDDAPYDAILVAASGRHVPEALKAQLKIGGALVMPVGEMGEIQSLEKIVRNAPESFEQSSLCTVRFVPLIGAEGWPE